MTAQHLFDYQWDAAYDFGGAHPGLLAAIRVYGLGPNETLESGLAVAHDQSDRIPTSGIYAFQSNGEDPIAFNQSWSSRNAFGLPSLENPLFANNAAAANSYENTNLSVRAFNVGQASAPNGSVQVQTNVQPAILAMQAAVQASIIGPSIPTQTPILRTAVVLKATNGRFFCSELGCDASYALVGDCRRHLKKHNGPFFYCNQYGCDKKFYRNDKLQDHLKKGHGIAVTAAVCRRRQRRTAN